MTGEPPHGPPPPGIPCVQEYDGVRKEFKDPKPDDPTADPKLCRDLRDGRPARDPKTGKFLTTADGKLRRYMPSEPPMPGVSPDEETPQAKAARSKFGGPIIKGNIEVEPKRP